MTWIHVRGVGPGRLVTNVLAGLKVSALLIFIALGFTIGAGSTSNLASGGRAGRRERLAAGADPGDVHLLGLECRRLRRRGDARSGAQRAARARDRHAGGRRDLRPPEPAVSLRAAGRASWHRCRAACSTSSPIGCSGRAPATSWAWSRSSASPRASARWCSPGRASTTRWRATACSSGAPRGSIRASRRRRSSIVAQAVWSGLLVLSGGANALTTYTGFCRHAVRGRCGARAVRAAAARAGRAAAVQGVRLSGRAGDLRARQRADRRQRALDGSRRARCATGRLGARGRRPDRHRRWACRSTTSSAAVAAA